ncbi:unnamed protein product, partial [Amoebophrya sp. A25]
ESLECWAWSCRGATELWGTMHVEQPHVTGGFTEKIFRVLSTFCGVNDAVSSFGLEGRWRFVSDFVAGTGRNYIDAELIEQGVGDKSGPDSRCIFNEEEELRIAMKNMKIEMSPLLLHNKEQVEEKTSLHHSTDVDKLKQQNQQGEQKGMEQAPSSVNDNADPDPKIRIACSLLVVWPHEVAEMKAHAEVTAPYCDEFAFVVAVDKFDASSTIEVDKKEGQQELAHHADRDVEKISPFFQGFPVRNLVDIFPGTPVDEWRHSDKMPNTVEKYHLALID